MKAIFIACGLILAGALAWLLWPGPAGGDHFGLPYQGLPAVGIRDLSEHPADFLKKDVRISGPVVRQCPAAGCWFFVRGEDGKEVKVEMGDTTPRLPQSMGMTATVEGRLIPFGNEHVFIGTGVEFRK